MIKCSEFQRAQEKNRYCHQKAYHPLLQRASIAPEAWNLQYDSHPGACHRLCMFTTDLSDIIGYAKLYGPD